MHFSLAYYLQKKIDADFFGIIDINHKPKKFFQNQKLVNFKKVWFYHDHIKKFEKDNDEKYLVNFENKYQLNLWKYAINERFFYLHNRFYRFKKEEIISILEQELKLFESILDETQPEYFLTYDPVFHHQKLLLDLCKVRGIKILSVILGTGIKNKIIIVEDGSNYDLNENYNCSEKIDPKDLDQNKESYDSIVNNYLEFRKSNFSNKLIALKDYLINFDTELEKSNFMYYGKSKLKVVKDALSFEIQRKKNLRNLQNLSTKSPNLDIPYVYYPMNIEEEMNILHYAPFFTDQIDVIRNIAKSIPIDHTLYVKEHIAAGVRRWHDISYYKQIVEIPNIILIRPDFDNNKLIENCKLLITTRGSSVIKGMKYCKPSIIFGEHPGKIMPSVFQVDSLNDLPELIKNALNYKVNSMELELYEKLFNNRLFEFNTFEYENKRDSHFYSGGILSNVEISTEKALIFLEQNEQMFEKMVNTHLTIIINHNRLNNQ